MIAQITDHRHYELTGITNTETKISQFGHYLQLPTTYYTDRTLYSRLGIGGTTPTSD